MEVGYLDTATDAERATFEELAPQFLRALPQAVTLPFALTYAAEALREGYRRAHEQPMEKGESRTISLTCEHEFRFYGVTKVNLSDMITVIVGETNTVALLLTERGHPDRAPEFFCYVGRYAVDRLLAECTEDVERLVDRARAGITTTATITDAEIAVALVQQLVDDRMEYDSRQAFALAYESVVSADDDPAHTNSDTVGLSTVPQLLDTIAKRGFAKLSDFHMSCLRRLFAAMERPFAEDAAALLETARDNATNRLYERALAEGTLRAGEFKPFDEEPIDGGFGIVAVSDEEADSISAMTPCPECEREVSSEAHTCPHCGKPLVETPHERSLVEAVHDLLDETVTESVPFLQTLFGCALWVGLVTFVLMLALFLFAAIV